MTNQLFFDGVSTILLPNALINDVNIDAEVGYPFVSYGSDNRRFYFSYRTTIPV